MRKRENRRDSPIERLRLAIDCMPVRTREAMLRGIESSERIIAGAYTDGEGGVCPMLAAHRAGGRTDFISFARTWDRFTRVRGRARAATERELRILVAQLQASLEESEGLEFDRAIADHRSLLAEGHRRRSRLREAAEPRGHVRARRLLRRRAEKGASAQEEYTVRTACGGAARTVTAR